MAQAASPAAAVVNLDNLYTPTRTASRDTIVFTIGKFNPPHVGHIDELGGQVAAIAAEYNADPVIFASDKTNKFDGIASKGGLTSIMTKIRAGTLDRRDRHKKQAVDMSEAEFMDRIQRANEDERKYVNLEKENDTPLTPEFKLYLLREIYNTNKIITPENILLAKGGLRGVIPKINEAGYKKFMLVVGSDRGDDFIEVLNTMAPRFGLIFLGVKIAGEERKEKGLSGTLLRYLANEAFDQIQEKEKLDPKKIADGLSPPETKIGDSVFDTPSGARFKELTGYPEITISAPELLEKFGLPEPMSLTAAAMYQIRFRILRGGQKRRQTKKRKKLKKKKSKRGKAKRTHKKKFMKRKTKRRRY